MEQLGSVSFSSDIFSIVKMGRWACELDEDKESRLYFENNLYDILGITGDYTPEHLFKFFYNRFTILNCDLNNPLERMKHGLPTEFAGKWLSPDKSKLYISVLGCKNPAYTQGLRIEGLFRIYPWEYNDRAFELCFQQPEMTDQTDEENSKDYLTALQILKTFEASSHFGTFKAFIFKRNKLIRIFWSDQFRRMLGYKNQDDFPNEPDRYFDYVHPQDMEISLDAVRKAIAPNADNRKYDVKYRMRHKNGSYVWIHAMGVAIPDEFNPSLVTLQGIIFDITSEVEKELYQNQQKLSTELLDNLVSEYRAFYLLDFRSGTCTPYRSDPKILSAINYSSDSPLLYNTAYPLFVNFAVAEEDREKMLHAGKMENIQHNLASQKTFSITYLTTGQRYHEMKYIKIGGEFDAPWLVIMTFADRHAEILKQQKLAIEEKKSNATIRALISEYSSIYYFDIEKLTIYPYSNSDRVKEVVGNQAFYNMSWDDAITLFINNIVYKDDRERMKAVLSLEHIQNTLKNKTYFKEIYRNELQQYCELKCVKATDSLITNSVILGFAVKDEEIRQQQQHEAEKQRNFNIIEGLASEYSSLYYVDTVGDTFETYTSNTEMTRICGSLFFGDTAYSVAIKHYIQRYVCNDDQNMMLELTSIDNLRHRLQSENSLSRLYKNDLNQYCEVKFMKIGDVNAPPDSLSFGFINRDAQVRQKMFEEEKQKKNYTIIQALASEYYSVYYIDLPTDSLSSYTIAKNIQETMGEDIQSGLAYSVLYNSYVDQFVHRKDKEMMYEAGTIGNIIAQLTGKKSFSTVFQQNDGQYYEMKFVKSGDEKSEPINVALGFINKDKEIRSEIARKKEREQASAVIAGLSSDFSCVLIVFYNDSKEVHYRFDPVFKQYIPNWTKIKYFKERIAALTEKLIDPEDRQYFLQATKTDVIREALLFEKAYYVNFKIALPDRKVYYQAKFVRDEKSPDRFITAFRNIDTQTRKELLAIEKAETANKAKTAFLFNMSHDIRTPMNAIIGFTNMAIKNIDNKSLLIEHLNKVQKSGDMLLSIINDILDMSRIESGKISILEVTADLYSIFDEIMPMMQEAAKAKEISLTYQIEELSDSLVSVDLTRVRRILMNLISNSIKYNHDGGWIKVCLKQLPERKNNTGLYQFTVEDNGIGMSEEFQKHLFEEFVREETATVSGVQGNGLGLALCKSFTDLMHGTITCKSQKNIGSLFTLVLPLTILKEEKLVSEDSHNISDISKLNLNGKRVLVVEDNDLNREIAVDILTDEGLVVEEAENGIVAVNMLEKRGPQYYDFILMDIQMPFKDGYEATRDIRAMFPDSRLPIIALSANAFEEDKRKSLEAGMDAHVAKPINVETLLTTLKNFVRN